MAGMQMTNTSDFGNDVSTFPDFPAEIRRLGHDAGVSGYQLNFAHKRTAADRVNA